MANADLKFGTSGLRGPAVLLDGRPAITFSRVFARTMLQQERMAAGGEILVGRDLRDSSPGIARYCFAGIRLAGAEPVDCGVLPTPALALRAMALGVPAIMVTGSHIPADHNGLKFFRPDGEIDRHDELAITESASAAPDDPGIGRGDPGREDADAVAGYAARALGMLAPAAFSGMRIGVYQHSSVARDLLVDILRRLGAEAVEFGRSDVFVPIDTEALGARDAELCRAAARQQRLHAIVSTDGDADRPLIGDEAGEFLRGDLIGVAAADALGADCVVTPVTSNTGIEKSGRFSKVVRTRIGSPHVIEGMNASGESGAGTIVGFEANGGVLLGTAAKFDGRTLPALPTRDALAPILAVLWAAKNWPVRLSSLSGRYGFRPACAGRLPDVAASSSRRFLSVLLEDGLFRERLLAGLMKVVALDEIDGVRLSGEDGAVLHYRASGNAPELRCYVEADTNEQARALLTEGLTRAGKSLDGLATR